MILRLHPLEKYCMSLRREELPPIPEETAALARAVNKKKKNLYINFADKMGSIYETNDFEEAYPTRGQRGINPILLILITIIQFIENLSDREVMDQIRNRVDLKYFLHLPLTHQAYDHSVLSEFRQRLLKLGPTKILLDKLLVTAQENGLVKGSKQRTDSTHVLAAVRDLNRLELVHETFRMALETCAELQWDWTLKIAKRGWSQKYGHPCFNFRIPKKDKDKADWIAGIGEDGFYLLNAIDKSKKTDLAKHPSIKTLRKVWEQQFITDSENSKKGPRLRKETEQSTAVSAMIVNPHDLDARLGNKRGTQHKGYKTHITETCDDNYPNLISHVETTPATTTDVEVRPLIERRLEDKGCTPEKHVVDAGYTDVESMVEAIQRGIDVIGPMQMPTTWQEKAGNGYALSDFEIDWHNMEVTCPEGRTTAHWSERPKESSIHVKFQTEDCGRCPVRGDCTKGVGPRSLQFKDFGLFQALAGLRNRQNTKKFKKLYDKRAGVEGTISLTIRQSDSRRSRYIGLAKTHLHIVAAAVGVNLVRLSNWILDIPRQGTRKSFAMAMGA